MSTNVQPLIKYLQQLQRKGESHVHLDENARNVLREFFLVAKGYKKHPSQEAQSDPTITNNVQIKGSTSNEQIQFLASQAQHWPPAKALGTLRDKPVFSGGDPNSDIMFITDAPGFNEEQKGYPFAGPAGEKLDGILKAMGLNRDQVYITHLVKFRPSMPNQTTANRAPSEKEINTFSPFIDAEIKIVQPKVIISLGSVTSQHLLESPNDIDHLRDKFHTIPRVSVPIKVTYQPSYLLNNEAREDKRKVWEDMLAVMNQLGMPITDKQQSYFKAK